MATSSTGKFSDPLGIVGTVVAEKYLILGLAGQGGFSQVYQARHLIWQQLVAIKFFVILEEADPNVRERLLDDFIREGKLMSELSSRSAAIVQARDIGKLQRDSGWIPYMVLEWLEGDALERILSAERRQDKPPRSLADALLMLEPVAAALDLAHRRNVAHRDLKPANIMLMTSEGDGAVGCKLLDFGIAKVMGEQVEHQQQLQLTGQQITAFTPNYGAPEQFSRQYGATGPWTDVFAMALILIEVLRGGLRALDGASFFELGVASSHPVRPTPGYFGLDVGGDLEAVFTKALAIAPSERYATMGEFWLELHRLVFPGTGAWQTRGTTVDPPMIQGSMPAPLPAVTARSIPAHLHPQSLAPEGPPAATSAPLTSTGSAAGRTTSALRIALGGVLLGGLGVYLALRPTVHREPPAAVSSASATHETSARAPLASAAAGGAQEGPCPRGMKVVNGGSFTMGSNDPALALSRPAHQVTLDTFCLDVHEVTAREYRACVDKGACKPADATPSYGKADGQRDDEHAKVLQAMAEHCNQGNAAREEHPINCVDWARANAYCASQGHRLPTEAEWELAARGADGRKFPWGDDPGNHTYMNAAGLEWRAWLTERSLPRPATLMFAADDGYVGTAPVGSFPRAQTRSGHLDLIGNVWEWTQDWYALYGVDEQVNPKGPGAGDRKALRGGGFDGATPTLVNAAARQHQLATTSAPTIGFRCAAPVRPAR
ncbi:MAG: SUMF1/EgtB/PvdO family nonheme iron enzyme [Deltaproteobacteria bacterium]|nr:SUMF1/EgtB/PvdO family nonheme iron enzyme [Deltaproteobacteria bacterium]